MRIEAYLHSARSGPRLAVVMSDCEADEAAFTAKEVANSRRFGKHDPLPSPSPAGDAYAFHYPLTVGKCREMREVWGNRLKVHRTVSDWYRAAVVEEGVQVANTKASDAELAVLPKLYPELNAYLKGDQRVTAQWVANAYRNGGLLADEVGTGKTIGVVAGIIERQVPGDILIVCPKISVKAVWWKEITRHTGLPVYPCKGTRAQRERMLARFMADTSPQRVLVVVAEMLRVKAIRAGGRIEKHLGFEYPGLFDGVDWDAIIVDESHKLLGSMDVVKGNLAAEGLRALSATPDRLKLAVSATPWGKGGRIEALFGTLHWLWPDEFTSRWAWLNRYFEVNESRVFIKGGGGSSKMVKRVGGLKDGISEDQFWTDLGPRVLRRTMEEVSPEHRGLRNWVSMACEMEPRQAMQYKAFSFDAELAVEGGIITTVGVLDYMTRCRQFANGMLRKEGGAVRYTGESGKLDRLMAHLDQLDPGRKVVISSQYNEFLDVVEDRLEAAGISFFRLDGKTSERNREAMMNAWQDSKARIPQRAFLLNSQAGGVSITLDEGEEMHQLDRLYPPEANTQLYGRIFRRGRAHQVIFYLYESMGTIDETITAKTEAGHAEQLRVLDGRRGLEYVRTLAQYTPEAP